MAKHAYIEIDDVQRVARALADPTRLRVLNALRDGELCVCQVTELVELAPSTVSRHMSLLGEAGLVEARKDGRWVYYRLAARDATPAGRALSWALEALEETGQARRDRERLERIVACEPEELCRRQRTG